MVVMSEFYNEVIKNRYLDTMENEGSRNTISYIFLASKRAEEIKEMDLYNFSKEDIEHVLSNMHMTSYHTARANVNYISNYINFCIKHGYRENNLNPLDVTDPKWAGKFVDRNIKIHYSYEEFIDLLEDPMMMNAQDQSFLFLIWEGILGERFSELTELRFEDIDRDNKTIYIKGRDKNLSISEECLKYLQKAYNQNTYFTFNPKTKEINGEKELLPSPYIFRNIQSPRSNPNVPVGMSVLYNRLHSLQSIFSLDKLTPNAIKQSGMIYQAVQLYEQYGALGYDQFAIIGEKYDFSTISNNSYTYFNTTLMKVFVNSEVISDLYGIEVEITKK
jgi:integrase